MTTHSIPDLPPFDDLPPEGLAMAQEFAAAHDFDIADVLLAISLSGVAQFTLEGIPASPIAVRFLGGTDNRTAHMLCMIALARYLQMAMDPNLTIEQRAVSSIGAIAGLITILEKP